MRLRFPTRVLVFLGFLVFSFGFVGYCGVWGLGILMFAYCLFAVCACFVVCV